MSHGKPKRAAHRQTNAARLLLILGDRKWHTTRELARRVGHTFGRAKFTLVHTGHEIERERHPSRLHQHQYRLEGGP